MPNNATKNNDSEDDLALDSLFCQVAESARTSSPEGSHNSGPSPSPADRLRLYGLYKQVETGDIAVQAPPAIRVQAYAKYQAHRACAGLTRQQAQREYLALAATQTNAWGRQSKILWDAFNSNNEKNIDNKTNAGNESEVEETVEEPDQQQQQEPSDPPGYEKATAGHAPLPVQDSSDQQNSLSVPTPQSVLGVRPLISRGQLDIGYSDLFYAARQCCGVSIGRTENDDERCIAQRPWSNTDTTVVVGLAARSLLDLYCLAKAYPEGSEVIMSPPINVPGMMQVFQYHRLRVVGVDLPVSSSGGNDTTPQVAVDVDGIQKAITDQTVAIMVVHPFGIVAAADETFAKIRDLALEHKLDVLEDCAEVFTGLGPENRQSSPCADVSFFSFGLIKTCTALGGGVAVVRDKELATTMQRMQNSVYGPQSTSEFFSKIGKACLLRFVSSSVWICGFWSAFCQWLGLDFEMIVTAMVRGFVTPISKNTNLSHIRKRPCRALLALLNRRLDQVERSNAWIKRRIDTCTAFARRIDGGLIRQPQGSEGQHTYWLCPVTTPFPEQLCSELHEAGFDATRGATQLTCVDPQCLRASELMKNTVYLPLVGQHAMEESTRQRLLQLLRDHGKRRPEETRIPRTTTTTTTISNIASASPRVVFGVVVFFYKPRLIFALVRIVFILLGSILGCSAALTWSMGDYYRNSSNRLAQNMDSLKHLFSPVANSPTRRSSNEKDGSSPCLLDQMESLKLPCHDHESSAHRKVILTGATGFLGSMILHDLLFHRKTLGIKQIVVFCRPKKGLSAQDRVTELLRGTMFSFLQEGDRETLVRVVEGDMTQMSAGVSESELDSLLGDVSISHVVHAAATVSFTQTIQAACKSNISSTLMMQEMASQLPNPSVRFVHISTAFVHGGSTGNKESPLGEELFNLGPYKADTLYESMLGTEYLASKALHDLDFPNTYTFSKCICEHLLLQNASVRTVIVRPSIIGPAISQPFEGWAGSKPSTLVAAACLYLSFQFNLWCLGDYKVPCIPVDVVSRLILVRGFDNEVDDSDTASSGSKVDCGLSSEDEYDTVTGGMHTEVSIVSHNSSISNAAWRHDSQPSAFFTWLEYASDVTQTGALLGYFSRSLAFLTLFVSTRVLPRLSPSFLQYRVCHRILVSDSVSAILWVTKKLGMKTTRLERLLPYLDLPVMFFPFMTNNFEFHSHLLANEHFDGKRYGLVCAATAHAFMSRVVNKETTVNKSCDLETFLLSSRKGLSPISGLFSSVSQPVGGLTIRLLAWLMSIVCNLCFDEVQVDLSSFAAALRNMPGKDTRLVVLAPTHRSFFDFMLLSMLAFSVPELHLQIPYVVAALEIGHLPFLGWLAQKAGALFIRRGLGKVDPTIKEWIRSSCANSCGSTPVLEVFVEGTRSRDRRFVAPKTGILKSILESKVETIIVPVTINYERIPEQSVLAAEICGDSTPRLSTGGAMSWLLDVLQGKINLGRAEIFAASPLSPRDCANAKDIADEIQRRQRSLVTVSDYHIETSAKLLGTKAIVVAEAVQNFKSGHTQGRLINPPTDPDEMLPITLQLMSMYSYAEPDLHSWAIWMNHIPGATGAAPDGIKRGLYALFRKADVVVDQSIANLEQLGYKNPSTGHVFRLAQSLDVFIPSQLIRASISFKLPPPPAKVLYRKTVAVPQTLESGENLGSWGFADSSFVAHAGQNLQPYVEMRGDRYKLCGRRLNNLLPFIEKETTIRINLDECLAGKKWSCPQRMSFEQNSEALQALTSCVSKLSFSHSERIHHGSGHCQQDIYAIQKGVEFRLPDVVVWPSSEREVEALVHEAKARSWCLVPYGGGTNVTQALRIPNQSVEPRPVISIDMRRMNKVLWVNEEDRQAHVQAGITGLELFRELATRGYTCGHQPDSYEFSTLGGWVATKASGMKRNKYGNIEDIVISVRVVGASGTMSHGQSSDSAWGRESTGFDIKHLLLGSEGCLGIITSAIIRVWKVPEVVDHDGILFNDFETGVRFAQEVSRLGPMSPASCRLLDNNHFRLGQALKPDAKGLGEYATNGITKALVRLLKPDFHPERIACASLTFEGTSSQVTEQRRSIAKIARSHGGLRCGPSTGKGAYDLTFMIAYLRDFAMSHHVLGESFETFVPWSKVNAVVSSTRVCIIKEHSKRFLPGNPFVGCRITQLYHEGACIYFYFCMNIQNVANPSHVYSEIEHAARREVIRNGGSLSHHHGVGKVRADFIPDIDSPALIESIRAMKAALDPDNIFGARNGHYADMHSGC